MNTGKMGDKAMSMDKTIRKITDFQAQKRETYRYWQSVPIGERIIAICELSKTAYSLKGVGLAGSRSPRHIVRVERA